ncbi:HAUS augmin-like complex subunit 4 [Dillenia turbinata]|uniref:HAUS augmin-like complex subunit 4 n=1 Tax=Dillenia turbinata TaxID=194707 RepID=A0AAN8VUS6_9MAGN
MEEHQQAVANLGGIRDVHGLYPQIGLKNPAQVYETLEHRLVVAEAAQRLRLPVISKDEEIQDEDIEKWSVMSRSSLDSTSTSITISSSTNSTNYANSSGISTASVAPSTADAAEPGAGEFDACLKAKCEKVADAFVDDIDPSPINQNSSAQLPERVMLIIEEIEREEAALQEDLYSADRKFAEYYNVLEQILRVLIELLKDLKLQHQHKYVELQKMWLCKVCETMGGKLRASEHILLHETYTLDTIPALHEIRKFLVKALEESSLAYNKAVTCLREYQGVDPHFDEIAGQYHDIVEKLENMQWTIHQVEVDLKRLPDHPTS